MVTFIWAMSGTAAAEQTWSASGSVDLEPGQFAKAFELSLEQAFEQLTNGKAVFGQPGVGCSGPYHITRFAIELKPERKPS
jgi:hypothetical protein